MLCVIRCQGILSILLSITSLAPKLSHMTNKCIWSDDRYSDGIKSVVNIWLPGRWAHGSLMTFNKVLPFFTLAFLLWMLPFFPHLHLSFSDCYCVDICRLLNVFVHWKWKHDAEPESIFSYPTGSILHIYGRFIYLFAGVAPPSHCMCDGR